MAKKKLRGQVVVRVYGSLKEGLEMQIKTEDLDFNENDLAMLGASVRAIVMDVIERGSRP